MKHIKIRPGHILTEEFGGDIDILLGKPMPVNAVREFGDILLVRGGKVADRWQSFPQ